MKKSKDYVLRMISDVPLLICAGRPHNNCWIYELNEVGKLIWEIWGYYETEDELISSLDNYFIKPLNAEQKKEVREYINRIKERGLVSNEK